MMNWHWSNLDKDYMLWHPVDHEGFCWAVPVTPDKFIGAVHKTLQGERAKIYSDPQDSPVGLTYLDPQILTPDFEDFLAPLFKLWLPVKHAKLNPYHDLKVEHLEDGTVKYVDCK